MVALLPEPIEAFLARCGATRARHSGRTLADHLQGTWRLLAAWHCDEATCRAGLFHSIYGTNAFRAARVGLSSRGDVRALIGAPAEHLVYLFHSAERPWAWLDAIGSGGVVSRLDGQFLALDSATLARLIEIECANLLEQGGGGAFLDALLDEVEEGGLPLDGRIVAAIRALRPGSAGGGRNDSTATAG